MEPFGFLGPHKNVRYALHSHTKDQLIWPVSGIITVEADKRLYIVGPGTAMWIPALTLHATNVRDGCSATLFVPKRRKAEHQGCRVIRLTPLFKELLKTATSQISGSLRFRRAVFDLIDDRGRSVSEVSISVGFNNPSAFACAFRRATGMSPVQFRASGDSSKF